MMNWQAIGAAGEVLGAIAVLLTLIYLTLQIRQNTKATRLQTAQATHQFSADGVSLLANVDTAVIWSKARNMPIAPMTWNQIVPRS